MVFLSLNEGTGTSRKTGACMGGREEDDKAVVSAVLLHLLTREARSTQWGGLVLITTRTKQSKSRGRFKIWQKREKMREYWASEYISSIVLERREFRIGCSGLLEREQEEKDASFIDNCPRRENTKELN